jgi:hypothetical protein
MRGNRAHGAIDRAAELIVLVLGGVPGQAYEAADITKLGEPDPMGAKLVWMRRASVLVAALLALFALAPAAQGQGPSDEAIVVINGDVTVELGQVVEGVFIIDGDALVGGRVDGTPCNDRQSAAAADRPRHRRRLNDPPTRT